MTLHPTVSPDSFFGSAAWAQTPQNLDTLLEANAKAAKVWFASWSKIASASADFLTKRWEQDTALVEKLMACQNPGEVLKVHSDFLQEAKKVVQLETEAGTAGFEV